LLVACAKGAIEILELKPEGKRAMSAAQFLSGRPELPAALR
jgi:methionyl-tRNA formyltransferase